MSRARNVASSMRNPAVTSPNYQTGPRAPIVTPLAEIKAKLSWGIGILAIPTILLTWLRYYFSGRDSNPFHDHGGMSHNEQLLAEGVLFVAFFAGLIGLVLVLGSLGEKQFDLAVKAIMGTIVMCLVAVLPAALLMHGWVGLDWAVCSLWLAIPFYTYMLTGLNEGREFVAVGGGIKES